MSLTDCTEHNDALFEHIVAVAVETLREIARDDELRDAIKQLQSEQRERKQNLHRSRPF